MAGRTISRASLAAKLLLLLAAACCLPASARAQTSSTFPQITTGAIDSTTPCTDPLVRTFEVTETFAVAEVQLGILVTHSWRGDLRITLRSPDGTRVRLVDGGPEGGNFDNLNVLLDDSALQEVNHEVPTGNHATTAPPYQHRFRPNNPLSSFSGAPAGGTWLLEICDLYPTEDNGSFRRADLILTPAGASFADLSLTKSAIGPAPTAGGSLVWRLTLSNSGSSTQAAEGVLVTDVLPPGFVFAAASGEGSYDPATGLWTVGSVPAGESRSIDIAGTVAATVGAVITNTAEITASSAADSDSTPANGSTAEDDYADASVTVAGTRIAGVPPALSCPAGTLLFAWDPLAWTPGNTTSSYPLSTLGSIGFSLSSPGTWVDDPLLGGLSPNLQTTVNGGTPGHKSLIQAVDLADREAMVLTTIALPGAVPGATFTLYDVDYGTGQFADLVTVEGRLGGARVLPVLTNGTANYVIGNSAYGDRVSGNDSADGNVVVTFTGPVDTIILRYGNYAQAPPDPAPQLIAIGDIVLCDPAAALSLSKTSTILSDPASGTANPKALPGALVRYCATVLNTANVPATAVTATDTLPPGVTFVAGSLRTGVTCAEAGSIEDDDEAGPDESDPYGASHATGTVTGTAASLAAGAAFAIVFDATID